MIIGSKQGNKIKLEATRNGFVYKNSYAFYEKSDDICYISEHGIEGDEITEETVTYKYSDFLELATKYVKRNNLKDSPEEIAEELFDSVDWQDPTTLLNDWEMALNED